MSNAALALVVPEDPTVYPVEGDVAEGARQRLISELLRGLTERWLDVRGQRAFVGADQFFYWKQHDPHECIAPDVYVVPGPPPEVLPEAWLLWKTGVAPSFAFEVVSKDHEKDYFIGPVKYARLGVEELVIFDPAYKKDPSRVRWQVYRRLKRGFVCVIATNADRVRSKVLGCYLRAVGTGKALRVRIGTGPRGDDLFPTTWEAERAAREQERAAREKAEAAREQERAAREQAEAAREQERAAREQAEATAKGERDRSEALAAELARLRAAQGRGLKR